MQTSLFTDSMLRAVSSCAGGSYTATALRATCKKLRHCIEPPEKRTLSEYCYYCLSNDMVYACESMQLSNVEFDSLYSAVALCRYRRTMEFICNKTTYVLHLLYPVLEREDSDFIEVLWTHTHFSFSYHLHSCGYYSSSIASMEYCIRRIERNWYSSQSYELTRCAMPMVQKAPKEFIDKQIEKIRIMASYGILDRNFYHHLRITFNAESLCPDVSSLPAPDWLKIAETNNINLVEFAWGYSQNRPTPDPVPILTSPKVTSQEVRAHLK